MYINLEFLHAVPRPISVRYLIRRFGNGSGLLLSLRDIINGRGWSNAWLFSKEEEEFGTK